MDDLTRLMQLRSMAAAAVVPGARAPPDLTRVMLDTVEHRQEGGDSATEWADIRRICGLPVRAPLTREEVEEFSRRFCLEAAYRRGFRLWSLQAQAIAEFDAEMGLLAPIGVGWGKTTIFTACAHIAFNKGLQRGIMLLPPQIVQGYIRELKKIRERIPVGMPVHYIIGSRRQRAQVARSKLPGLYVFPYSFLSTEDTSDLLDWINPDYMLPDEIHMLKHLDSARTQRIAKFRKAHPGLIMAGGSGTITARSLNDYWHLAIWCLGARAPVPSSHFLKIELAATLDADAAPSEEQKQKWNPLRKWAREWFPAEDFTYDVAGLRRAFQLRLTSAPGVVASGGDNQIDTRLVIRLRPAAETKGFDKIETMMEDVRERYMAPNGEEISHAIETHRWLRELTVGFYNEQLWPTPAAIAKSMHINEKDALELLRRAQVHHALKNDYNKALREWLGSHHRDKLDTPNLVGTSMFRHGAQFVGKQLYGFWKAMKDLEFADMPERYGRAVRICDYKIAAAVGWAEAHREGGILWVYHREIGIWLMERLTEGGFANALQCPAGANAAIEDPANRDKLIVASMAHREGKNLQFHQHQHMVEWPRHAPWAEQLLGRLYRNGQEAEVVYADCNDTTEYDHENRAAGLNDALYESQVTGSPQRVIYCEYDPLPMIMPSEVLRERGFENKLLTELQRLSLAERFGKQGVDEVDQPGILSPFPSN